MFFFFFFFFFLNLYSYECMFTVFSMIFFLLFTTTYCSHHDIICEMHMLIRTCRHKLIVLNIVLLNISLRYLMLRRGCDKLKTIASFKAQSRRPETSI